jgi:hypothetical protein
VLSLPHEPAQQDGAMAGQRTRMKTADDREDRQTEIVVDITV